LWRVAKSAAIAYEIGAGTYVVWQKPAVEALKEIYAVEALEEVYFEEGGEYLP
jgi:hypothetical protein